jgi:biotin carboxylase
MAPADRQPPHILLIGCRRQLLEAARRLGLRVTTVGGPWEKDHLAEVFAAADTAVLVDDPCKVDLVLAALARHRLADCPFAAVVSASDEYVGVCALLSGLLTASPLDPWTTLRWRDKALQNEAVADAGVPVAASQVIDDVAEPPDHIEIAPPFVIKPAAGAGAANLRVAESHEHLHRTLDEVASLTPKRTFVLQELIEGTEYQLDAVIESGRVSFLSVAEYLVNPLSALSGSVLRVATVDARQEPDLYAACTELVTRSAAALGIVNSVVHLEAFRQPDGRMVFGECGVRLGGCFTPEMVQAKYGIDLAEIYLRLLVGLPTELRVWAAPGIRCRALLPTKPGVLRAAPTAEELLRRPGVVCAEIQHPIGALLPEPTRNAVTRLGEIVVAGDSPEEVNHLVDAVVGWFLPRVVVTAPG